MTRNQKIALGCGGVGCLGLIVLAVVGVVGWTYFASSSTNRNRSSNLNLNSNSNTNSNPSTDANENSSSETTSSSSSFSDDEKHRLFQAAGITKDSELMKRVLIKLGFMSESGVTSSDYETFLKDHFAWALKNTEFIMSVNSPERARAYVDEHLE